MESQVSFLHENDPAFIQIKKKLFELESYCSEWKTGSFDKELMPSKVSPESDDRLKRLNKQLNILCPDEMRILFSWHLRFTPGAGRIYFHPDEDKKKIYRIYW